jgi:hypothetical protein
MLMKAEEGEGIGLYVDCSSEVVGGDQSGFSI